MSLRATTGKQDVSLPHAETSEEMLGSNRILLAVVGPVCCGPGVGGGARWGITQLAPLVPLCASVPDLERGGHLEVRLGDPCAWKDWIMQVGAMVTPARHTGGGHEMLRAFLFPCLAPSGK